MPDKVCELVSLTHQRSDTLVSDNVSWWLATLEVLARPPAWRQCRLSAVSAGLTLVARTRWSLNQHSKTLATGILANLPAGLQPDVTYYMLVSIKGNPGLDHYYEMKCEISAEDASWKISTWSNLKWPPSGHYSLSHGRYLVNRAR